MFCCWDFMPMKLWLKLARHTGETLKNRHHIQFVEVKSVTLAYHNYQQTKKKILAIPKIVCVSLNVSHAVSLSETLANILWPIFVIKWKTHYIFSKQSKTELMSNRQDFRVISFHQLLVSMLAEEEMYVYARIETCVQMMWAYSIDIRFILANFTGLNGENFRLSIVTMLLFLKSNLNMPTMIDQKVSRKAKMYKSMDIFEQNLHFKIIYHSNYFEIL